MCCLFGILNYSGKKDLSINHLVNSLACEATVRGSDASGIAYNKGDKLTIYKKPLSAWDMDFKGLENVCCVTGHTRHTTQGNAKFNYNNHPFMGYCENTKFALAHNGILWNDYELQKIYSFPKNRIETDSYIAVQLLEHFKVLNFANIKKMAELVEGSFSFSIMDNKDNLYLVKGDSPLSIIHFPDIKLYVYASTDTILFKALSDSKYLEHIKTGRFNMIHIKSGDILKIDKWGKLHRDEFDYSYYSGRYSWYDYIDDKDDEKSTKTTYNTQDQEIDDLKSIAYYMGISADEVDALLTQGFSLDDIENYIYEYGR